MAYATAVVSVANRVGGTEECIRRSMIDTIWNPKGGRRGRAHARRGLPKSGGPDSRTGFRRGRLSMDFRQAKRRLNGKCERTPVRYSLFFRAFVAEGR